MSNFKKRYRQRKEQEIRKPDSSKPKFPRREDFPSLERYRYAMKEYDLWVEKQKSGLFFHFSKYPLKMSIKGTTYLNPVKSNRLPLKVRKSLRPHRLQPIQ